MGRRCVDRQPLPVLLTYASFLCLVERGFRVEASLGLNQGSSAFRAFGFRAYSLARVGTLYECSGVTPAFL